MRAGIDVRPYADDDHAWWVVSDLTPGLDGEPIRVEPDHVLGVSPASTSLAQLTIRDRVGRALDLGTGCGVQSLHLAGHSDRVVATDVNPRALAMTRFNAALNGLDLDVRDGSLWEPVAGERFDLITTNPPFVISPATGAAPGLPRLRPARRPGRRGRRARRAGAPDRGRLVPGRRQLGDRPRPPLAGAGRGVARRRLRRARRPARGARPASYVELWLKDAGRHGGVGYLQAYDAWLGWFDEQGIEGVGFGWVNLRRGGAPRPARPPYAVEQPIAAAVARVGARPADRRSAGTPGCGRGSTWCRRRTARPGAADPETIVLRQRRGLCRARQVDTVEAALVGACDGDLTVGQILDALASLLDRDPDELATAYLPAVRGLVDRGVPRAGLRRPVGGFGNEVLGRDALP